jgi:hypothetical protein
MKNPCNRALHRWLAASFDATTAMTRPARSWKQGSGRSASYKPDRHA